MSTKEINKMSNSEYMKWVVEDWNNLIANLREKDKQKELNKKKEADTNANS